MPHVPEDDFAEFVALPYLENRHPDAIIERDKHVQHPDGFVDVWVDLESHILAVEIGNGDDLRADVAQAIEYASHDYRAVPMVIVPAEHMDRPTAQHWRQRGVVVLGITDDDVEPWGVTD